MTSHKNNVCLLFTKKYPFGKQETYIHYEIEYLSKVFDLVYIIPVEEFDFGPKREIKAQNVFIFPINQNIERTGLFSKLINTIKNNWLLLKCTVESREKLASIKSHFLYVSRLIHMRAQGIALEKFLKGINSKQDIICYHYWMHNSIVVEYLSGIKSKKTITRAHALDLYHKDWPSRSKKGFLQFEKLKIKYCDLIFSISEHGLRHFNNYFPQFSGKFRLNRLGILDENTSDSIPIYPYASSSNPHKIVTCSSLNERKQLHLMPEILQYVKSPISWIHIGGNVGTESEKLNKSCAEKNIEFHFVPQQTSKQIFDFYQNNAISLFCNLSYAEGIPVSIMEAAMFGIPLLATNTFGNPEIVNEQNGILIPPEFCPQKVAADIDELLINKNQWEQKSRSSRSTYLKRYNSEINLIEFLNQII